MGVRPVIIHFQMGFSVRNHPFGGTSSQPRDAGYADDPKPLKRQFPRSAGGRGIREGQKMASSERENDGSTLGFEGIHQCFLFFGQTMATTVRVLNPWAPRCLDGFKGIPMAWFGVAHQGRKLISIKEKEVSCGFPLTQFILGACNVWCHAAAQPHQKKR